MTRHLEDEWNCPWSIGALLHLTARNNAHEKFVQISFGERAKTVEENECTGKMAFSMEHANYNNAIPSKTYSNRWTALDSAAEKGHGNPVEQLVCGIPRSAASSGGHEEVVHLLLDKGAAFNVDTASNVNVLSLQAASVQLCCPESIFDIVAVHGLHADPKNTWTSRETNVPWLQDFLPHDVPDARVMSIGYKDDAAFNKASEDALIMRVFLGRKSLLLLPLVTRQSRKIPRGTAQHYASTIQLYGSKEQSRHDNLCRCVSLLKHQHHLVYHEEHVWCYLLQYFIGLLIARENTLGREYCTIDATDGGRTCHPPRELWRRRPKASLSMFLTPARRMWGKTADLLSNQHQKLAIPILMLWVKPVSAKSSKTSERRQSLARVPPRNMSSSHQLLLDAGGGVLRLWANPHDRSTQNSPTPQALLLGCFLCTSLAVIVAYIHRNDRYQTHFLIISSMPFVGEGAFFAADLQDFVFRYLLLGVSVGLGLSALFHRAVAVRHNLSCGRLAQEKSLIALRDEKTQGRGDEKLGRDGASMSETPGDLNGKDTDYVGIADALG